MALYPVIPGRDIVANPETRAATSGFRVRRFASPRNDGREVPRELQFKQLYETIV
jgi:hypothetical protein